MQENIITDVLVIGGGAAAARAAVEAAASGLRVDLVDKGIFSDSGTSSPSLWGMATTFNQEDSDERFFEDWTRCGGHINDQNLLREIIAKAREAAEGLEAMGVEFFRNPDGSRSLHKRVSHSAARIQMVKVHGPEGRHPLVVLREEAEKRGCRIHEGIMITRLLQKGSHVMGAVGISPKRDFFVFNAKALVLAAGGCNRLYPNVATLVDDPKYRTTGDGLCLAFAAGAPLIDMEFTQFRDSPPRGALYGGRYLNALGKRFMEQYEPQALEMAPRYRMVEALYRELKAGRGPIRWEGQGVGDGEGPSWMDKRTAGQLKEEIGVDFQRILGGTRINERTETPVLGLFAAGESSGGVHGADRGQGNAFLETQVFGLTAGKNAAALALKTKRREIDPSQLNEEEARIARIAGDVDPAEVTKVVQKTMWQRVGVVRDSSGLREALDKFEHLRREKVPRLLGDDVFAALEASNLLLTAEMVARAALAREETRKTQIRNDFPAADDNWLKHVCITNEGGEVAISTAPIS
ncbi:MAG: FAD-binding protein [Deltaproteobacteria bacterium]|nr:MAG: FAD-binding protein [Deltaproteobacteria bacterium]